MTKLERKCALKPTLGGGLGIFTLFIGIFYSSRSFIVSCMLLLVYMHASLVRLYLILFDKTFETPALQKQLKFPSRESGVAQNK